MSATVVLNYLVVAKARACHRPRYVVRAGPSLILSGAAYALSSTYVPLAPVVLDDHDGDAVRIPGKADRCG